MIAAPRLIGILVVALLAGAVAVPAQPSRVYRIGVVLYGGPYLATVHGLRDGLKELGWEESKQFILDVRNVKGDLRARTTPIVFYAGTDPSPSAS